MYPSLGLGSVQPALETVYCVLLLDSDWLSCKIIIILSSFTQFYPFFMFLVHKTRYFTVCSCCSFSYNERKEKKKPHHNFDYIPNLLKPNSSFVLRKRLKFNWKYSSQMQEPARMLNIKFRTTNQPEIHLWKIPLKMKLILFLF